MNEFLKILLSLSLSGTLLTLLLFLLRPLWKNRLSKRWQYYIWLVVIARLLIPWTPEPGLIGNLFLQAEYALTIPVQEPDSSDYITDSSHKSSLSDFRADLEQAPTPSDLAADSSHTSALTDSADTIASQRTVHPPLVGMIPDILSKITPEHIIYFLAFLWLTGTLLLFVRKVTIYQSFVKYIHAGSRPVEDISLLEHFGQIIERNKVKGRIELYTNSLVSSPLLIGFIHPRIVLPDTKLSDDDFYCTILHELTHYQRHDMFYKWLVQLTICLHWFNPCIHMMGKEINRLCELSCDERVISLLPENMRNFYGDMLLHAIRIGGSYKDSLSCFTLYESKELLKGRLDAIIKYRKKSKRALIVATAVTFVLIGSTVSMGAYAASDNSGFTTKHSTSDSAIPHDGTFLFDEDKEYFVYTDPDMKYTIFHEDNVFRILADGATMADCPTGCATDDSILLTLVYKDSYHSFLFNTSDTPAGIADGVASLCEAAIQEKRMTKEQADLMADATGHITKFLDESAREATQSSQKQYDEYIEANRVSGMDGTYYYRQTAYFQKPHIIELGWNLPPKAQTAYDVLQITLTDGSAMPVYFAPSCKRFMSDEEALSSIAGLLSELSVKTGGIYDELPIRAPFVTGLEYVGDANLESLAKNYYAQNRNSYFTAIFLELDGKTQQEYLEQTFREENISFFMCCMDALFDEGLQGDSVERYILKSYQEDNIAFFSCLCDMLDEETKSQWVERCERDGRTNYLSVLADSVIDSMNDTKGSIENDGFADDGSAVEEDGTSMEEDGFTDGKYLGDILEEKGLLTEYNHHRITSVKNDYYYCGHRVRLLMDTRADNSFENFSYNKRGTVDIHIQRDGNNAITHVLYLSEPEANKILSDIYGSSQDSYSAFPLYDSME